MAEERRKKLQKLEKGKFQFAETEVSPNDFTKRNEKYMKFDSASRVLNLFNQVLFDDMETDSATRHSTHCNKNSIFGVDSVL